MCQPFILVTICDEDDQFLPHCQNVFDLYFGSYYCLRTLGRFTPTFKCGRLCSCYIRQATARIASQFARDSLKQSFFEAFIDLDGQFDAHASDADILTLASQGLIVWILIMVTICLCL